jgi:murein DD-endopeptidase MepM/ murein hydrolase activator NlpD
MRLPTCSFLLCAALLAALPASVLATGTAAVPVAGAATEQTPVVTLRREPVQGAMMVGAVPPGSRVLLGERALRVDDDGTFVFGLDRDAPAQLALRVRLPDGREQTDTFAVKAREYRIQKVTGIAERIMNPTDEDQARIARENAQISRARQRDDGRRDFLQAFAWPAQGPITGVYGSQRYYNGVPKRPHYGVDVGIPVGTPVYAPADGVVTLAHPDMFYSGGTLLIDHGHGISSTLMHLSEVLVKEGDAVRQGDLVAKSGASGRASGPHLDWRMNWFGERIDPQLLVPPMPAAKD